MPLSAAQAGYITDSWAQLAHLDLKIAEIFYQHLFENEPELRQLFRPDMESQYRKLVDTLGFVVNNINNPDLDAAVRQLAIRHVGYGVKKWHYDAVGESLIYTLRTGMGDKWTMEMSQAWEIWYDKIAAAMIDAAESAAN